MTTFVTVPNTDIDQDSPFTQPLLTALRDNPVAIGEADSSVALGLLPTVSLGSLTATSGTAQTLSSLDLTPYRFLTVCIKSVAFSGGANQTLRLNGTTIGPSVAELTGIAGISHIEVNGGRGFSVINTSALTFDTSITSATTSLSFTWSSGSAFTGASDGIEVYGCK